MAAYVITQVMPWLLKRFSLRWLLTLILITLMWSCSDASTDEALSGAFLGEALSITPATVTVAVDQVLNFSASNGIEPYTYQVFLGSGSINGSFYTAPADVGEAIVRVTDARGKSSFANVTISYPACPTGYIPVPPAPALGTNTAFCIAKYEMKCAASTSGTSCSGQPISQAANRPWVNVTHAEAISACASLGSGYALMSNAEFMTIARNLEASGPNWRFGIVNSNGAIKGHFDNNPSNTLAATTDDADGCFGTGNNCNGAWFTDQRNRRTFNLTNGQIIWDISGNAEEWVSTTFSQTEKPYDASDGGPHDGWRDFNVIDTYPAGSGAEMFLPLNTGLDQLGAYHAHSTSSTALTRGGYHGGNNAGMFTTYFYPPTWTFASRGFRCVFRP